MTIETEPPQRSSVRFTLRQLDYFVAVAEAGSIKQASEAVKISQPAISTAVSDLEKVLGVELFLRHHAQGVSLTTEGRRLLAKVRALLHQAAGLQLFASELRDEIAGPVTVGALTTIAPALLPQLMRSFASTAPDVHLSLLESNQETLRDRLRQGEIDLALTYDLELPTDIGFEPLARLPPYAYFAADHPFAGRASVALDDLVGEGLVLFDLPLSREYLLSLFMQAGQAPRIAARSAYPEVVRAMVANGIGYGLANLRLRTDRAVDGKRFVVVPLEGQFRPMVLGLAMLPNVARRRAVAAFADHCRAMLPELL
jgi:DNA-binding transcriptional LysR family regulator